MSYNEFHKGKLHKLTRGMSETENKVKELTKQYDVPFDEDEDLSIYQDDEDIIYNSNNEYYGTEELETVEKEILDSDVEDLELKED